jgi:hypothetical protein
MYVSADLNIGTCSSRPRLIQHLSTWEQITFTGL